MEIRPVRFISSRRSHTNRPPHQISWLTPTITATTLLGLRFPRFGRSDRSQALNISDFEYEKSHPVGHLFGDDAAIADVMYWRKPDRTFDGERLDIDLGKPVVQFRSWCGQHARRYDCLPTRDQNSLTGHLIGNEYLIIMRLKSGPHEHINTLARVKRASIFVHCSRAWDPLGKPVSFDETLRDCPSMATVDDSDVTLCL